MKLKNMLIISVFLHACFFTAALLLSELSEGGSKIFNEKVFIVKIVAGSGSKNPETHLIRKRLITIPVFKAPDRAGIAAYQQARGNVSSVSNETGENKDNLKAPVSIAHEELSGSVVEAGRGDEDNSAETLSGKEISVNIAYNRSSSENGAATESENSKGEVAAGIFEVIRSSIERVKTYPVLARKRGVEGTVYVSFRIDPEGKPHNIKVLEGSGFTILDDATVDIVKRAAPFPYVGGSVEIPVVFRLE